MYMNQTVVLPALIIRKLNNMNNMDTNDTIGTARNVSDVESVIQLAKLNACELMPVSQVVEFSSQLIDQGLIQIAEMPNELVDGLISGMPLVIRGDGNDSAVLCSNDRTYDLKEAETSNSLLLVDRLKFPEECQNSDVDSCHDSNPEEIDQPRILHTSRITGIFYRYLELKECQPRLEKLRKIIF